MVARIFKRLFAVGLVVVLLAATGQTSGQLLTYQDVVDNVNAGQLKWSGAALGGSQQIISRATFVASVSNNGSCNAGGNANYVMTFGDMMACRVLTSAISNTTDPCIVTISNWPVVSGSASYSAYSSSVGSCGSGNAGNSPGATAGSNTYAQALNGGAAITSGTRIFVSGYIVSKTTSFTDGDVTCGSGITTTVTGSGRVVILDSANNVVASSSTISDGAGTFEAVSATYTPTSTGSYKAGFVVATGAQAVTYAISNKLGGCASRTVTIIAGSSGTNITASN